MNSNDMKSCAVATPKGCNCATLGVVSATCCATTCATPSLKALANKVLERNSVCNPSATGSQNQRNLLVKNGPEKLHIMETYSCFKLHELRDAAGDDWDDIKSDKQKLIAFAHALRTSIQIRMGVAPNHYTKDVHCIHCGTVKLWPNCSDVVHGCPWCLIKTEKLQEIH